MTGPELPLTVTRESRYLEAIADAASYVQALWSKELEGVAFKWADLPSAIDGDRLPLWHVDRERGEITLYRVVHERVLGRQLEDEWQERFAAEAAVFRAAAEYLGKDPWEVAPDRYRHG